MNYLPMKTRNSGFTLVELLVVMSILGVLMTIAGITFRSSQLKGHDAQRKSELKEVVNALELFYGDYNQYPASVGGKIAACPYNPATHTGSPCQWGESAFTDGVTTYHKTIPADPSRGQEYNYQNPASEGQQAYQLFAALENLQDPACIGEDCKNPPVSHDCGTEACNFAITSSNTTPLE